MDHVPASYVTMLVCQSVTLFREEGHTCHTILTLKTTQKSGYEDSQTFTLTKSDGSILPRKFRNMVGFFFQTCHPATKKNIHHVVEVALGSICMLLPC